MNDLFAPPGYSTEFEAFWSKYPRRHGTSKLDALRAWERALRGGRGRPRVTTKEIMAGLEAYPFSAEAHLQPHAATWLNQARWQQFEDQQPVSKLVPEVSRAPSKTAWMEGYLNPGHFIEGELDHG